jgi:hypothetical protein
MDPRAVGIAMLMQLNAKIDKVHEKVDIKFAYFPMEEGYKSDSLFRESERVIRLAKTEILALNSYAEESPPHPHTMLEEQRVRYFRALEEMSAEPNMRYVRIIQIENDQRIPQRFHQSYINHFQNMIEQRERSNKHRKVTSRIELKRIEPKFPATFVIIDKIYLLWQLNEIDSQIDIRDSSRGKRTPKSERIRMRGVVIVYDPRGQFIPDFLDTFLRAENQENHSVTRDDLRR